MSKATRKKAAKKAVRTRKKKYDWSIIATTAAAAGKISERRYVTQLKKKKSRIVLNGSGIPDIIAYDKGWKFYEIKPYKKSGHLASPKGRLLNSNQVRVFKKMVSKKYKVFMVYYSRKHKRIGKKKHKYNFDYDVIRLTKNHFKNKKGPDPKVILKKL